MMARPELHKRLLEIAKDQGLSVMTHAYSCDQIIRSESDPSTKRLMLLVRHSAEMIVAKLAQQMTERLMYVDGISEDSFQITKEPV